MIILLVCLKLFLVWGWIGCSTFIYSIYRNNNVVELKEIIPLILLGFRHGIFTPFVVSFNNDDD